MAKKYGEINSSDLMTFDRSFSRAFGQPLDATSVYYSIDSAQTYAKGNNAYVGQIISVVTTNGVDIYKIVDTSGTIEKIGTGTGTGSNQNTFSTIKVDNVNITADEPDDTITFLGSNVTFTKNTNTKEITFNVAEADTTTKGIVRLVNSITNESNKVPTSKAVQDALSDVLLNTDVSDEYNSTGTNPVNGKAVYGALSTLNIRNGKVENSSYQKSEKPNDAKVTLGFSTITNIINPLLATGALTVDDIRPYDKDGDPINITTDKEGKTVLNIAGLYDRTNVGVTGVALGSSVASGKRSFSAGSSNAAINEKAFAVGCDNYAAGLESFAANYANFASGQTSAAFGSSNLALGDISFTVGVQNIAYGDASFVGGTGSFSKGQHSFAFGNYVIAAANNQTVFGKFNRPLESEDDALFILGNGEKIGDVEYRSNAMEVTKDGHIKIYQRNLTNNQEAESQYLNISYDSISAGKNNLSIEAVNDIGSELTLKGCYTSVEADELTLTAYNVAIVSNSKTIDISESRLINVSTPEDDTDAANKTYVDNKIGYRTSVPTKPEEIANGPEFLILIEE